MATWSSRFSLSLLAAVAAFAQPPFWPGLHVEIKLQHEFYFPGEDIHLTIAVRNDTPGPMMTWSLFAPRSNSIRIHPFGEFGHGSADYRPGPFSKLAPGAAYRAELWLSEACRNGLAYQCHAPQHRAPATLHYFPCGVTVALPMVEPMLEQQMRVAISPPWTDSFFGPLQQAVYAVVLSHDGSYYVALTPARRVSASPEISPGRVRFGFLMSDRMGLIRRVATTNEPIDQLRVHLTEDGGAVVSFRLRDSQVNRTVTVGPDWIRADRPELQPGWPNAPAKR